MFSDRNEIIGFTMNLCLHLNSTFNSKGYAEKDDIKAPPNSIDNGQKNVQIS